MYKSWFFTANLYCAADSESRLAQDLHLNRLATPDSAHESSSINPMSVLRREGEKTMMFTDLSVSQKQPIMFLLPTRMKVMSKMFKICYAIWIRGLLTHDEHEQLVEK
jgi:hypothetical protein